MKKRILSIGLVLFAFSGLVSCGKSSEFRHIKNSVTMDKIHSDVIMIEI